MHCLSFYLVGPGKHTQPNRGPLSTELPLKSVCMVWSVVISSLSCQCYGFSHGWSSELVLLCFWWILHSNSIGPNLSNPEQCAKLLISQQSVVHPKPANTAHFVIQVRSTQIFLTCPASQHQKNKALWTHLPSNRNNISPKIPAIDYSRYSRLLP